MEANDRRLAECQRVIGYYFSSSQLLETALTHSSLRAPDRECNERLEFLGDSVLGLVITEELYRFLPDSSEGELTRIKSVVVSRGALYRSSKRLGLETFAEYARGVGRRDELPTSVVANLAESIIGAIYLDAGYYPAREFVLRHMGQEIEDVLNDRGAKNYKSLLQHEVQQAIGATPHYRTLEAEGPDHAKQFVVAAIIQGRDWGRATGANKKSAEQEAARMALEAWARRGRGRRRRRGRGGTVGIATPAAASAGAAAEVPSPAAETPAAETTAAETTAPRPPRRRRKAAAPATRPNVDASETGREGARRVLRAEAAADEEPPPPPKRRHPARKRSASAGAKKPPAPEPAAAQPERPARPKKRAVAKAPARAPAPKARTEPAEDGFGAGLLAGPGPQERAGGAPPPQRAPAKPSRAVPARAKAPSGPTPATDDEDFAAGL